MTVNNTKEDVTRMVLDYLRKNLEAGDTLEGISRWWLETERVNRSVDEVSNVLEALNRKGIVTRQDVRGSNPIYKICSKT